MHRVDLLCGVGLVLFGFLLIFLVIPMATEDGMHFGLPPTFFPTLLSTGMVVCAAGLAIHAAYRIRSGAERRPVPITGWNLLMFASSMALVVTGVIIIDLLNIIVGGPLLIAGFMVFLGERNLLRILATSTLPVAAVYFLAIHVLRTPLP
ncbi:tripartite tricarboxylate transporter TctB family protein [Chelativorans sp. AA-79]|uniref:tripartite tricarboxylate transporter TctB family protein n=1 Tax=Chelativorans sp. AA-79 TaxID=3028735 RepID=UPI0023F80052|nr:tripartite tricarboxylate transporter TctB family protein [Chelativorans sp. AA-79]WEX11958.1 tripartite tricarboxylate transporter TctB family protein [Chelativorans sp. AA-79]